jgi:hypothetical protein
MLLFIAASSILRVKFRHPVWAINHLYRFIVVNGISLLHSQIEIQRLRDRDMLATPPLNGPFFPD